MGAALAAAVGVAAPLPPPPPPPPPMLCGRVRDLRTVAKRGGSGGGAAGGWWFVGVLQLERKKNFYRCEFREEYKCKKILCQSLYPLTRGDASPYLSLVEILFVLISDAFSPSRSHLQVTLQFLALGKTNPVGDNVERALLDRSRLGFRSSAPLPVPG